MPNNNNGIFNAALQGASGGTQQSRWLSNSDPTSYSALRDQCVIFATAVDAAIAPDATLTQPAFDLMQAICAAVVANKFLTGQTSGNLSLAAAAIAAYWTELKGQLAPQTDIVAAVPRIVYVNGGVSVTGNGSASSPYKTIQEAASNGANDSTIFIAPFNYAENVVITGKALQLIGMGVLTNGTFNFGPTIQSITTDTSLAIENATVTTLTSTAVTLAIRNCPITTLNANNVNVFAEADFDVTIGSIPLALGALQLVNYLVAGNVSCVTADLSSVDGDGSITGTLTCTGNMKLNNYQVTGAVSTTADGDIANSKIEANLTVGGNLTIDSESFAHIKMAGHTVAVTGTTTFKGLLSVGVVVNVPVLAANAIGSLAVDVTATVLGNIATSAIVQANEPNAGVAGGGFLATAFVSSAGHITYKFHGPTNGGNQTFPTVQLIG